ncbi:MAG: glucosaminidase domain-containing protein [Propionibacteriaceae bacterium]|jgi:hypothetical protein|nr:glucosaminidase domain-containing protein [Propionibacteriaceae bacterium]
MRRRAAAAALVLVCLLALPPTTALAEQSPSVAALPVLPLRTEPLENTRTGRFIQSLVPFAQAEEREFGVPTSVSLAQAIVETGWGYTTLNEIGFNYFGIKCTRVVSPYQDGCWNLSTYEYLNGEYVSVDAGFRTYATVADSFMDHGRFLRVNERYADAFETTTSDDFAQAIAAAGYATSPTYAQTLISVMTGFELYNYDLRNADPVTIDQPISVTGGIGSLYYSNPIYAQRLGVPIGGEENGSVDGTKVVIFNRGLIFWSQEYGAHAIYGEIWDSYRRGHAARGSLGRPVSSTIVDGELISVVFEHGRLDQDSGAIILDPTAPVPQDPPPPNVEVPASDLEPATPAPDPKPVAPAPEQPAVPPPATASGGQSQPADEAAYGLPLRSKIGRLFPAANYRGVLRVAAVAETAQTGT